MAAGRIVYICETCMAAAEAAESCCGHTMVQCDAGTPGSQRSQPLFDEEGRLRSQAPRWWLERHGPQPWSERSVKE